MWDERNTGTNLPAQIDLQATDGAEYKFLFMAKGGGSANKSYLYQETKAVLNPQRMTAFLDEKLRALGTAACPPYHLAVVIGRPTAAQAPEAAENAPAQRPHSPPPPGSTTAHAIRELDGEVVRTDLPRPMGEVRAELSKYPIRTRLSLTGPLVVARDIAHAKIAERLAAGQPMPCYLRDHAVYYAGPAKTPAGYASGSFGPTTAGRMDSYVDQFQAAGGSLVMLAKGNRSPAVTEACRKHGGVSPGASGRAAPPP